MRPLSVYSDCGGGYGLALVQDGSGPPFRAGVDLNDDDGTPQPRVILADGRSIGVGPGFVAAYRSLTDAKALRGEDREELCGGLVPEEAPLTFRGAVEFAMNVSPQGLSELPLRGLDAVTNQPTPKYAGLGIAFRHRLSEDVGLEAGIGVSYHGDTVVSPGVGLQNVDYQPDIQGFLDVSAYGLFAGVGVRDQLMGAEATESMGNFAVSKSYNRDFAVPSFAMNAGGGYRHDFFELSLRYVVDGAGNPGFLATLAVLPTDGLELRLGVVEGPEVHAADEEARRWLGDFRILYAGDVFGLMLDAAHGEGKAAEQRVAWTSVMGMVNVQPEGWPVGAFGGLEYFADNDGSRFGVPAALLSARGGLSLDIIDAAAVASPSHKVQFRAEWRSDWDVTPDGPTSLLGAGGQVNSIGFLLYYDGQIPFYSL